MKQTNRKQLTLLILLTAVTCLLVVGTIKIIKAAVKQTNVVPLSQVTQEPGFQSLPSKNYLLSSLENYRTIVDRPLFSSSRRPAENKPEKPEQKKTINKPEFSLIGVVITPEVQGALIRKPGKKKIIHSFIGEKVDGWRLTEVHADRVVFIRDGRLFEAKMKRPKSTKKIKKRRPRKQAKSTQK